MHAYCVEIKIEESLSLTAWPQRVARRQIAACVLELEVLYRNLPAQEDMLAFIGGMRRMSASSALLLRLLSESANGY